MCPMQDIDDSFLSMPSFALLPKLNQTVIHRGYSKFLKLRMHGPYRQDQFKKSNGHHLNLSVLAPPALYLCTAV